jgi:hypothetical protein
MAIGTKRRIPFDYSNELLAFQNSFSKMIEKLVDERRSQIMPAENVESYQHGISWRTHASYDPDRISKMETHSHEMTIKFNDIINNDSGLLLKHINEIVDAMYNEFMGLMYRLVAETSAETGQNIDAKQFSSTAEAFVEALEKIEFGIDRHGNPSLPQFHVSPEMAKKLFDQLSSQGPEFEARVEDIKRRKISEAQEREAARRAKFVRYEENI